jgi:hypothetical protein
MLIPGSTDCRLVRDDDSAHVIQLSRAESMTHASPTGANQNVAC